jgi:cell division protein FtsL
MRLYSKHELINAFYGKKTSVSIIIRKHLGKFRKKLMLLLLIVVVCIVTAFILRVEISMRMLEVDDDWMIQNTLKR